MQMVNADVFTAEDYLAWEETCIRLFNRIIKEIS
jgi:hypothetical protein